MSLQIAVQDRWGTENENTGRSKSAARPCAGEDTAVRSSLRASSRRYRTPVGRSTRVWLKIMKLCECMSGVGKLAHGHPIQIADSRLKVHLCIATSWGKGHPDIREISPRKPNSLTARVSSAAATVALCIANDANPPNRSVLLEIAAASLLFTVTAISAAAWGSAMPCMQGDEQERTIY